MVTKVQTPIEEYLHTTFEPDREYLDGEVVERNVGNDSHSEAQWRLCLAFGKLSEKHPVHGRPELRVRVTESHYRIVDLAVYVGEKPSEMVPSTPPLVAIEILSPDDPMSETLKKLEEYRRWGVAHVWLVDPQKRALYVLDPQRLDEARAFELPEFDASVASADIFCEPTEKFNDFEERANQMFDD